jgi:hypothetical protein
MPWSADCITNTFESKFSASTGLVFVRWGAVHGNRPHGSELHWLIGGACHRPWVGDIAVPYSLLSGSRRLASGGVAQNDRKQTILKNNDPSFKEVGRRDWLFPIPVAASVLQHLGTIPPHLPNFGRFLSTLTGYPKRGARKSETSRFCLRPVCAR